ncbi:MAG: EamA/RhaT family transporter [Caulobacteraceae bacterium]
MLWIAITVGGASLQVARNALQRSLLSGAGPWGATLVRFVFGLPFALTFASVALVLTPHAHLAFSPLYFLACAVGGATQIGATAALLVSMRRSSFALGTVFQQSSILFAALIGLAFGETLHPLTWFGLVAVAAGVMALGWPRRADGPRDWSAAGLGLVGGLGFGISSNAFRQAAVMLAPHHAPLAAQMTLVVAQSMQSAALVAWLAMSDRKSLVVALTSGRKSLGAGFFGAAASGFWFTAFALSPAGPVRAVGVVELPIAVLAGQKAFNERLAPWQWIAAAATALGVILTALG